MTKVARTATKSALTSFLGLGSAPGAALAADLSRYRDFHFAANLAAIAKQVGLDPSTAKLVQRRPALIQELEWRPQPPGVPSQTEAVKEVFFSFYNGQLYQISVNYDRYATEGLTADDLVEAISATYGASTTPTAPAESARGHAAAQPEILARWHDSKHCFDLTRSAYGPTFQLVGVLTSLEPFVQAAFAEAARLDDNEAPQKEADRVAREAATERARLEKARLVNKPRFRT